MIPARPRALRAVELARRYQAVNYSLLDQGVVSISTFVTAFALARTLPVREFGIFAVAQTGLLLFVSLSNSVVTQPHNFLAPQYEGEAYRRFTGALGAGQLLLSVLIGSLLVVASPAVTAVQDRSYGLAVAALGVALVPWLAQEFVRRALYTRSRSRAALVNDTVSYGLQAVVVVALASSDVRLTAASALLIMAGSSLLAALLGVWQLRHDLPATRGAYGPEPVIRGLAEAWGMGRWLTASEVVKWFGTNGHLWLLLFLVGTGPVGRYRAAYQLINVVNPLRQAVQAYLPSRAARAMLEGGRERVRTWTRKVHLATMIPFALIVLVLAVAPGLWLRLAYGSKYHGSTLEAVIVIGAIAQLVNFLRTPVQIGLLAMGESSKIFMINCVSVVLLLTVGVACVSTFGIVGAPVSQLVIGVVLFVVSTRIARAAMSRP